MSGPLDSHPDPSDSGDAWVYAPDGRQFWGTYGAAGLLAHDRTRGVLLQHRVEWSHFGGTWALPGGARHRGESAVDGAYREAAEEAGVPAEAVRPRFSAVTDLGFWSYTTVVGDVTTPFEPEITDPESLELRWVPIAEVDQLPLHPGFEQSWPALRAELERSETIVVDAANVVGARPDGWWKDRASAADRLLAVLERLAEEGLPAAALGLEHDHWWPRFRVVLEGAARAADTRDAQVPELTVVRAPGEGDEAIVHEVRELTARKPPHTVWTITSDRELRERVEAAGSRTLGSRWLWERIDALSG
ncbi:NUDIX domain-containing protein [Mycetocola tolaasinivorans]|uniref:NUDIX domain-containing protein n=1 Tax=Mycetocola tolaasinivorans TaxID=76635 RepID=UPI001FE3D952|nr:NUDIX domain-containing protein [Mycetocola tolaasinivorans]